MSEYWIHEDGDVDFADGDVGDYNHEGIVINTVQGQIIDAVSNVCRTDGHFDSDHWDDWKQAAAEAYAEVWKEKEPALAKKIDAQLAYDPDKILNRALKEAGVKKADWQCACGIGDARDYAMERWGWKTYRDGNIDTWKLTRKDLAAIIEGAENIAYESGWSKKKTEKYRFSINVFMNRRHFYLSIPQMKEWINSDPSSQSAARINHDSTDVDLMQQAAANGTRAADLALMHPYYAAKKFPFGDAVIHSFKAFLEYITEKESNVNIQKLA